MPSTNVEFKAELRDPDAARAACRSLDAVLAVTLEQVDTYYRVTTGRLKRRESTVIEHAPDGPASLDRTPEPVEYIRYSRADRVLPKRSEYSIYTETEYRERFGSSPLERLGEVRKMREVWLTRHARIHLDVVEQLGTYLEFECLVTPEQHLGRAHELMSFLRGRFGPVLGEPIAVGYIDLVGADGPGSFVQR